MNSHMRAGAVEMNLGVHPGRAGTRRQNQSIDETTFTHTTGSVYMRKTPFNRLRGNEWVFADPFCAPSVVSIVIR